MNSELQVAVNTEPPLPHPENIWLIAIYYGFYSSMILIGGVLIVTGGLSVPPEDLTLIKNTTAFEWIVSISQVCTALGTAILLLWLKKQAILSSAVTLVLDIVQVSRQTYALSADAFATQWPSSFRDALNICLQILIVRYLHKLHRKGVLS